MLTVCLASDSNPRALVWKALVGASIGEVGTRDSVAKVV